ncbi:MAG: acyl-carrier domain protein [Idiomarinaceae bacterium HL-53]|nr:MAG: acyl-carrier domain protein [Idiomarinaceae bacterium HL-53]CUS47748.1 Malonyl CoA-acyl carrier protein transacylase [Idiomarinaceae bacterium HL-53]
MTNTKKRVVVVCPGRGTYNRNELGYLARYHERQRHLLAEFDSLRQAQGRATLSALDSAPLFKSREHLQAQNAAPLIYSCALFDFLNLNSDSYEIVAVTGNSMGWYIALACAGALEPKQGFELVSGMSDLTQGADLGGQLIYPIVDEHWRLDPNRVEKVHAVLTSSGNTPAEQLYISIEFGGYAVLAGSHAAIRAAKAQLPVLEDKYPLELPGHSAFHTPLMERASEKAFEKFNMEFFNAPKLPLIDGDGRVWQPELTSVEALRKYTLQQQVTATYGFSKAIRVALREFTPDALVLTGPGSTMGGAIAQEMIAQKWHDLSSKEDFVSRQAEQPLVYSMGLEEQRRVVARS